MSLDGAEYANVVVIVVVLSVAVVMSLSFPDSFYLHPRNWRCRFQNGHQKGIHRFRGQTGDGCSSTAAAGRYQTRETTTKQALIYHGRPRPAILRCGDRASAEINGIRKRTGDGG